MPQVFVFICLLCSYVYVIHKHNCAHKLCINYIFYKELKTQMSFNKAGDCFTKIGTPKGNLSLTIVKKNFFVVFSKCKHTLPCY